MSDPCETVRCMCGRYATTRSSADLSALFEATDEIEGLAPDYNVAPTDPVPIVRRSADVRVLKTARWGLVPTWAKDARGGARMINARAETVATSRAFAPSFAGRRCLVPADGWYEWVRGPSGGKQAYFMTLGADQPCVFGGIWAVWGSADQTLLTCGIVTAPAVGDLELVHDRMPLLLPPRRWEAWLSGPASADLLAPTPAAHVAALEIRPVGAAVGDVRNDGPQLIDRVPAPSLASTGKEAIDLTLF